MPRTRLRQKILQALRKALHQRRARTVGASRSIHRHFISSSSSSSWSDSSSMECGSSSFGSESDNILSSDSDDSNSIDTLGSGGTIDYTTKFIEEKVVEIENTRYINGRGKYRNRQYYDWDDAMSYDSNRYNEEEFLRTFRVRRESFHKKLVNVVRQHTNFMSVPGKRKKATVAKHLLVFLYRVGCLGDSGGDEAVADYFGLGKGTVKDFCRRVAGALKSLKWKHLVWPDEDEKQIIKQRIKVKYGFQNCVGIIDGTLIFLLHRPLHYGDSYYCRKNAYAINVQIICDDQKRIRYVYGGWPGSTHDNRAWRNCKVFRNFKKYFQNGKYLLSDSAYSSSAIIVASLKKTAGELGLTNEQSYFNTEVRRIRVVSEHCIGILKNRFPCLKCLNIQIEGKETMKEAMALFESLCILHNILIDFKEEIPDTWYEDIDSEHYWTEEYCPVVTRSFNQNEVESADERFSFQSIY